MPLEPFGSAVGERTFASAFDVVGHETEPCSELGGFCVQYELGDGDQHGGAFRLTADVLPISGHGIPPFFEREGNGLPPLSVPFDPVSGRTAADGRPRRDDRSTIVAHARAWERRPFPCDAA
jgi:hypothetical protein